MRILLDTCSFLWLLGDSKHLSSRARTETLGGLVVMTPDEAIRQYAVPTVW